MIKQSVTTRLYCTRDSGLSNSAPKGCLRRATRGSARGRIVQPSRATREILVEGGANPGMNQKVLFHPREVVCGLDRHVPERGGSSHDKHGSGES